MKAILASAGTGLAGSAGGLVAATSNLSLTGLAVVTGISCLFGMLSSASRLAGVSTAKAIRVVLMNGGAVWVAAFALAAVTGAQLATAALIGLGVGLAGSKALEVIEGGALAVARRVSGKEPVTKAEMEKMLNEKIGDARNDAAAALAEVNVKRRRDQARSATRSDQQDTRMDGFERPEESNET